MFGSSKWCKSYECCRLGMMRQPPAAISPATASWAEYTARWIQHAEADGLRRAAVPYVWYCPHCEKDVDEGQLEAHLLSNKHKRYISWSQHHAILKQLAANGELPRWMELRGDGTQWCTLCYCTATETHIASQKHKNKVAWDEMTLHQGPTAQAVPAAQDQCALVPVSQPCGAQAVPRDWGDPSHFEWKSNEFQFWCKLCWKYATDNHVQSDKHKERATNSEAYLYDAFPSQAGAPPPPPGRPPSGTQAPPPAPQADAPPPPLGAPQQGPRVPPQPLAAAPLTVQPVQSPPLTAARPKVMGYPQPATHGATTPAEPRDPWMDGSTDPWGGSQPARQRSAQSVASIPAREATSEIAAGPQFFDMAAEDAPSTAAIVCHVPPTLPTPHDVPLTMPANVKWERHWDDRYGRAYFWNPETEDSRWEMPREKFWREDV